MSTNDRIAKTSPIQGHVPNCECSICAQNIPFSLPEHIVDQYIEGSLIIFAGAGVSTENKNVLDETLYERLSWAYMEALYLILDNDPNSEGPYPVLFYAIGWDKQITSRSQFKKMLKKLAPLHKLAAVASQKYVKKIGLPIDGSIIVQHKVAI